MKTKKTLALLVSAVMTLSLLCCVFTVPAFASTNMPTSYELQTSVLTENSEGDYYLTEIPFTIEGEDTLVELDGPYYLESAEAEKIPFGTATFMISAKPAGDYTLGIYVLAFHIITS